eukprot:6942213-Pyramimonas_sp.AAC.1
MPCLCPRARLCQRKGHRQNTRARADSRTLGTDSEVDREIDCGIAGEIDSETGRERSMMRSM